MDKITAVFLYIAVGICLTYMPKAYAEKPDCNNIVVVDATSSEGAEIGEAILSEINRSQANPVEIYRFRTIQRFDRWIIAEIEFDLLEAGIFVIEKVDTGYRLAAVYGGVALDNPADTIRQVFITKLPDAPKELFYCYHPKGPPFRQEGE
jgi:hypothetical protein